MTFHIATNWMVATLYIVNVEIIIIINTAKYLIISYSKLREQ